jgi:hypothetical protein
VCGLPRPVLQRQASDDSLLNVTAAGSQSAQIDPTQGIAAARRPEAAEPQDQSSQDKATRLAWTISGIFVRYVGSGLPPARQDFVLENGHPQRKAHL